LLSLQQVVNRLSAMHSLTTKLLGIVMSLSVSLSHCRGYYISVASLRMLSIIRSHQPPVQLILSQSQTYELAVVVATTDELTILNRIYQRIRQAEDHKKNLEDGPQSPVNMASRVNIFSHCEICDHRIISDFRTHSGSQNCLRANCPDFITKDQWLLNSLDLNTMDYHVWGAMLEAYRKLKTKLKTIAELKEALQVIWGNLPYGPIDKAVKDFSK